MAGRLSHFGLAFGSFRLGVQAILAACWGHFGLAKLDDVAHGGCVCVLMTPNPEFQWQFFTHQIRIPYVSVSPAWGTKIRIKA